MYIIILKLIKALSHKERELLLNVEPTNSINLQKENFEVQISFFSYRLKNVHQAVSCNNSEISKLRSLSRHLCYAGQVT